MQKPSPSSRRAWIEIAFGGLFVGLSIKSPSSRRAWIEIENVPGESQFHAVALLAEGVDRNVGCVPTGAMPLTVALLAEGVDRNFAGSPRRYLWKGRPPRGGRG